MNNDMDFTKWLVNSAIFSAIVGLAIAIPQHGFPRNALVAIAMLACIIIGSIVLRDVLTPILSFFRDRAMTPEAINEKAKRKQLEYDMLMNKADGDKKKSIGVKEGEDKTVKPPLTIKKKLLDVKIENGYAKPIEKI